MYKYKAKLVSSQEIIAEANSLEDLEAAILSFRRKQKQEEHTRGNESIQILHVERDNLKGTNKSKEELIKTV